TRQPYSHGEFTCCNIRSDDDCLRVQRRSRFGCRAYSGVQSVEARSDSGAALRVDLVGRRSAFAGEISLTPQFEHRIVTLEVTTAIVGSIWISTVGPRGLEIHARAIGGTEFKVQIIGRPGCERADWNSEKNFVSLKVVTRARVADARRVYHHGAVGQGSRIDASANGKD